MKQRCAASLTVMAFLVLASAGVVSGQPNNTAYGIGALQLNQDGVRNTAFGAWALYNDLASNNTATGAEALFSNTTGEDNVATGMWALRANTTGLMNVATGSYALWKNVSGTSNTATGHFALGSNTTGYNNVAFGNGALNLNTTGWLNTAVGTSALYANVEGTGNVAVGGGSLQNPTAGSENVSVGYLAMAFGKGGSYNAAVGTETLWKAEGDYNLALGAFAGYDLLSGSHNVFLASLGEQYDANTIRIGRPYLDTGDGAYGQNKTFIAGIVENPLAAAYGLVGIQSDGQLGTLDPSSYKQGPPGPMGPAGPGLVPGSLLFLPVGMRPPDGYRLTGTTQFTIQLPPGKPSVLKVNVYQMQ